MFELEPSWHSLLQEELSKPYIALLEAFLDREWASGHAIYPPKDQIFRAFWMTPYAEVKVVIVGQDPYHGPNQAEGLCFSVPEGVALPPSLRNIYKEIKADLGVDPLPHGNLLSWAKQGVLLLNATLSVREGNPLSHHKRGWEIFTDAVIAALAEREDPVIFVMWGKSAQDKCHRLPQLSRVSPELILSAAHPSPFSAHNGFFGCRHFSKINALLERLGKTPISWGIRNI